jgi:hypothetical protein
MLRNNELQQMLNTLPDYSDPLNTVGDFIEMGYNSLSKSKRDKMMGLFNLYGVKNYLEHHFKLMRDRGIETEDIFLGTWDFIAKDMPKLNKDIQLLKNDTNEK